MIKRRLGIELTGFLSWEAEAVPWRVTALAAL